MSLDDIINYSDFDDSLGDFDYNLGLQKYKTRMGVFELVKWFKPIYDLKTYNALFNHICMRRNQEICMKEPSLYAYETETAIQEAEKL